MVQPKSLLMPLSTSGHVSERLQGALSITAFFGAHLEVLHAQVNPRQFIPEDVIGLPHRLIQELESVASRYSDSESSELQALFEHLCRDQQVQVSGPSLDGVPSAHWQEVNGLRSELVAERGKVADLIIIPQSKSGKPTSTFEAAIMRSGKPVLLVPRTLTRFHPERVLIAWNGSTEGGRAVTHALPVLQQAREVVIATSQSSAERRPNASDLLEYLGRHGVTAATRTFDSQRRSAGEGLLALAREARSDLLVMGAFTHRRMHEQIFGGVTRFMTGHAQLPVWMMH